MLKISTLVEFLTAWDRFKINSINDSVNGASIGLINSHPVIADSFFPYCLGQKRIDSTFYHVYCLWIRKWIFTMKVWQNILIRLFLLAYVNSKKDKT